MFSNLRTSAKIFSKDPLTFILQTFYYGIFQFVTLCAGLGLFLILLYIALLIEVPITPLVLVILAIPSLFLFLLISSGIQGSLARSYAFGLKGVCIHLTDFFDFALKRSTSFFVLFLIFAVLAVLSLIPYLGTHFILNSTFPSLSILKTLSLVASGIGIIFSFAIIFPMLVSMGAFGTSLKTAGNHSVRLAKAQHILSFLMCTTIFLCGALVVVPFANIISLLVFLPVLYGGFIIGYERTVLGSSSAVMPVQDARKPQPKSKVPFGSLASRPPTPPAQNSRRRFGRKHEGLI